MNPAEPIGMQYGIQRPGPGETCPPGYTNVFGICLPNPYPVAPTPLVPNPPGMEPGQPNPYNPSTYGPAVAQDVSSLFDKQGIQSIVLTGIAAIAAVGGLLIGAYMMAGAPKAVPVPAPV